MTKEELQARRVVALKELRDAKEVLCLDDHYIDIIEQENAELKAEIENDRDLPTVAYMQGAENQKKKDEKQLTKAKEIIKKLIELVDFLNEDNVKEPIIADAEQFLKEIEK